MLKTTNDKTLPLSARIEASKHTQNGLDEPKTVCVRCYYEGLEILILRCCRMFHGERAVAAEIYFL